MTTVWKKILDTSYEVSDKGEVKNASGKILKYVKNDDGYHRLTIYQIRFTNLRCMING